MDETSDRDGGSEGTHSITVSAAQVSQLAQQIVSLRGGVGGNQQVTVLQLPSGEQVQVHGVIQAAAPSSVIRSPVPQHSLITTQQQEEAQEEDQADSPQQQLQRAEDSTQKAARELLARRPSYRKILKELSGGERGEEEQLQHLQEQESAGASTALAASMASTATTATIYQTSTGQYFAIAPNGSLQFASPASSDTIGLQTLNMGGGELHQHLGGASTGGTTILQYAQTSDGQQILVPSNQVVVQTPSGDMQTYQIRTTTSGGTTTSLPQTVLMSSPLALSSAAAANAKTVDPQLKREIRLMKNMEAARECRRKKKEYVKCLENRVAVLENQNRTLIEELKTLKDLYCHK